MGDLAEKSGDLRNRVFQTMVTVRQGTMREIRREMGVNVPLDGEMFTILDSLVSDGLLHRKGTVFSIARQPSPARVLMKDGAPVKE